MRKHGKISVWKRLCVGLMLGIKAFRKGFSVGDLYLAKGDSLTVTYTLEVK